MNGLLHLGESNAVRQEKRKIALDAGLQYVYEGNIHGGAANTVCPGCGKIVIRRSWHDVIENLLRDGACSACGHKIPGRWSSALPSRKPALLQAFNLAANKYGDLNL